MGIFVRKSRVNPDKIYSMAEALKILKNPQYVDYTSVEVGQGMYRIVLIKESISNYPEKKYNNYQNARGYIKNAIYR